jgi:hypothetical protein
MATIIKHISGRRLAKQPCGPPALSLAPTEQTAAIEGIIDADPVAACVREIMAERSSWTGSAADLLRAGADRGGTGWPGKARRPTAARADPVACHWDRDWLQS